VKISRVHVIILSLASLKVSFDSVKVFPCFNGSFNELFGLGRLGERCRRPITRKYFRRRCMSSKHQEERSDMICSRYWSKLQVVRILPTNVDSFYNKCLVQSLAIYALFQWNH